MIKYSSMYKATKKQGKSPAKMHISLRVRTPAKVRKTLWYIIEKPKSNLAVQFWFNLAGEEGFALAFCKVISRYISLYLAKSFGHRLKRAPGTFINALVQILLCSSQLQNKRDTKSVSLLFYV